MTDGDGRMTDGDGRMGSSAGIKRVLAVVIALAATIVPSTVWAEEGARVAAGKLKIEGAWTREPPPGARVGGAYLTITNGGDAPDRLLGGTAAFAERIEIHSMSVTDGVMRMREIEGGLEIAPDTQEVLEPGGNHVMMMGLTDGALEAGDTVRLRLRFERAGEVEIDLPVAAIGARGPS